jgi:hypothetical protein
MKKLLVLFIVFLSIATLKAQENGILYTNYDPDLYTQTIASTDPIDTIKIDLDRDGTTDLKIYIKTLYSSGDRFVMILSSWRWRFCRNNPTWQYGYDPNDTILTNYGFDQSANSPSWLPWNSSSYSEETLGFNKTVNNENYYAWAKVYFTYNGQGHDSHGVYMIVRAYCDEVAYCTIPDYPLRWGQTSMEWDVDENNMPSFADIHPNPTNGAIAITGKDLKKAEVFNSQGQQVLSAQCQGDQLTFDLGNLPAGLYFVNVTDEKGQKTVKKIVKQ